MTAEYELSMRETYRQGIYYRVPLQSLAHARIWIQQEPQIEKYTPHVGTVYISALNILPNPFIPLTTVG